MLSSRQVFATTAPYIIEREHMKTLFTLITMLLVSTAQAENLRMLTHGEQSLAAHLSAIRNAKSSVDLMTYLLEPCDSAGKLLLGTLADRARRGVTVRVIIDAYQLTGAKRDLLTTYFAENRIQFKLYNDSSFFSSNNRSHMKILLIDGATAKPTLFADGSNLTDQYFGLSAKGNYIGNDMVLRGAAAYDARRAFDGIWSSNITSVPRVGSDVTAFRQQCLGTTKRDAQVTAHMNSSAKSMLSGGAIHGCTQVEYVVDNPSFMDYDPTSRDNDGGAQSQDYMTPARMAKKQTTAAMLKFINGAQRSLNMENPYYLPVYGLSTALDSARARRVNILILTNKKADSDVASMSNDMTHFMAKAAARDSTGTMLVLPISSLGGLNDRGSLSPKGTSWIIHAKTAVRDHRDIMVSSFNLDPRSYNTNLEAGVVIHNCPSLAREIEAHYKQLLNVYVNDRKTCARCSQEQMPSGASLLGYLAGAFL
jgi:putative cardiolipin synthase